MPFITARVISVVRPDAIAALAFAGNDQSVLCASVVQLEGSITGDDIANHTFEWEQTFGTPITLINPNTLTPSFVNPQVSDIEITLYIDRNTPYEDSDTVFISRGPQDAVTYYGEAGTKGLGGTGAVTQSNLASTNVVATDKGLRVLNPTVDGYSYTNPPEAKYSPIFKASDLDRVRKNVKGAYWLMNDIDLSDYDNWDPIGTATKPFSGELQGNGFKIDGLTISGEETIVVDSAPNLPDVTTLSTTDSLTVSGDITSFPNSINWTPDGLNCAIPRDTDDVLWYSASSPFDFNTLTLAATVTPNYSGSNRIHQIVFNDDGTKAFWSEYAFARVYTFNLSTPYDLTECNGALPDATFEPAGRNYHLGLWISLDGTKMYITDALTGVTDLGITNYTLSTPWDLSTATEDGRVITDAGGLNEGRADGVIVNGAGTRLWMVQPNGVGPADDEIIQLDMSIPHDLTTAAITGKYKVNNPGVIWMTGLSWSPGAPNDVWIAYTSTPRTLRRVTGDFGAQTITQASNATAGLFAYIGNGAVIEDVGVTNASISNFSSVGYKGILAGSAQGPTTDDGGAVTVRNSYVEGTVGSGGDNAGGLIGHTGANASSIFENTYADVTVTGGGTDEGGWTGTFSGTPTYIENYSNTTKTASVVGTGAPGGTEVDGRTTDELVNEDFYTGWDFVDTWNSPVAVDAFFDNVILLCEFEGTDGATTSTDGSSVGNTLTFNGTAEIDTADFKIGTSSLLLDGNSDYVSISDSNDFTLGSGDWTMEAYVMFTNSPSSTQQVIAAQASASGTYSWSWEWYNSDLRVVGSTDGISYGVLGQKAWVASPTAGQWYHVVFCRLGNQSYGFIDGVSGNNDGFSGTLFDSTSDIRIGSRDGTQFFFDGQIDNLRITKGVARYTQGVNFTPPSTPHGTTTGVESTATLQFDTNNNIRIGGFCDDQWMVQWGIPTYNNSTATPPSYIYKGAIVEERVAGGWSLPRFIPPERNAALMTPDTPHRVTAVWDFYYNTGFELRRFPNLYTAVNEVGVTDDRLFNSQNTSDRYGLYGTDSYTIGNGSASSSTNFTITISNPRKIAKTENELLTVNGGSAESTISSVTILRTTLIQKPTQDPGAFIGAGSASYSDNLTVTRVNGSSIG